MANNVMVISSRKCGKKHVSYNTIIGLEDEFTQCAGASLISFSPFYYSINKLLKKFKISGGVVDLFIEKKIRMSTAKLFFAVMSIGEIKTFKITLKRHRDRLILYVFDCWESQWKQYQEIFNDLDPWVICFAYKKAKEYFSLLRNNCYYLPQSMDVRYFHAHEIEKKRLFMQMGRRTDKLHKMAVHYLKSHNIDDCPENYIYERVKGEVIFPEVRQLAEEISKSYFFLAAPQNIENRSLTGAISETTARFYEAMACKTLIVGIKPMDSFDELFPYENAMIEVDEMNFDSIIDKLWNDKEHYYAIVEKNYKYVMEHHRWKNRYELLMEMISTSI